MSAPIKDNPNQFEEIVTKLQNMVLAELKEIEAAKITDTATPATTEQKLKTYTGFFKLVQLLEETTQEIKQKRDKKSDRGIDILEFRKQLEKQITKLVDNKIEEIIS